MTKKISKNTILIIISTMILIIVTILVCIKLVPLLLSLQDENNRIAFENYVQNLGIKGVLLILFIQIIQIFIAFIPGEIVELLAGLLYGTWGGLAICLLGNVIASILIYITVKIFAKKYMIKYKEKLKQYSFLNNKHKVALYLFILYLIPGIPKDIITYLVPFLPINFALFLVVTSIARIPSIISSTYSSYSFLDQNYTIAIVICAIFAVIAIVGYIFKDKIIGLLKKDNDRNNTSH